MIYILADDLTGASDTGVQFTKHNFKSRVYFGNNKFSRMKAELDEQVVVLDTETREVNEKEARSKVQSMLQNITFKSKDIIYKKIDSTLRGNIGAEIETVLKLIKNDFCIINPAFPANERYVINGNLYVGGLDSDHKTAIIKDVLQQQTDLKIGFIDHEIIDRGVSDVRAKLLALKKSKCQIIITDAKSDIALQTIIAGGFAYKGPVLYAGSAGLAQQLSLKLKKDYNNKNGNHDVVLIVAGSRTEILKKQINYLQDKEDVFLLDIDVDRMINNPEKMLEEYMIVVINKINEGKHIVMRPDPYYNNEDVSKNVMKKYAISFRSLEQNISRFLGKLSVKIVSRGKIKRLILTGGDTALGVCSSLGIDSLYIIKELLPGIPLTTDSNLLIVTKAGDFGTEEALVSLVKKLTKSGGKG